VADGTKHKKSFLSAKTPSLIWYVDAVGAQVFSKNLTYLSFLYCLEKAKEKLAWSAEFLGCVGKNDVSRLTNSDSRCNYFTSFLFAYNGHRSLLGLEKGRIPYIAVGKIGSM
jgi:hypothetical protein